MSPGGCGTPRHGIWCGSSPCSHRTRESPRSQGHGLWSAGVARRGLKDGAGIHPLPPGEEPQAGGTGKAVPVRGMSPGNVPKPKRTKLGIAEERNHPSAAGGDPLMAELLVPQRCSELLRTELLEVVGAPGGGWSSQDLPYFRQVRCGVCFFCTSSRQRLRSSSQGSSKFCGVSLGKGRPKATTGR